MFLTYIITGQKHHWAEHDLHDVDLQEPPAKFANFWCPAMQVPHGMLPEVRHEGCQKEARDEIYVFKITISFCTWLLPSQIKTSGYERWGKTTKNWPSWNLLLKKVKQNVSSTSRQISRWNLPNENGHFLWNDFNIAFHFIYVKWPRNSYIKQKWS